MDIPCHGFHGTRVRSGTASKTREGNGDVGLLSSRWSRSMTGGPSDKVHQQIFSERSLPMPVGQSCLSSQLGHVCPA